MVKRTMSRRKLISVKSTREKVMFFLFLLWITSHLLNFVGIKWFIHMIFSDVDASMDKTKRGLLTLRGSSAGKGLGQSPLGRRFEPQQGHWRHYKPAASPGTRGTNRGGPALKQRDPVGTASRVHKATPGNHADKLTS
ncbi:hypothetical protein MTR67_017226 [Solanum verrucosum]|uniref:Uncharacterized protein n=1 Tax=Solanum verrucosum TaxID=315347 RepID=A0AAF0TLA3_SOLVR|nr:hypothetical protein MTR67_017226 [Solanum verrucosum]